MKERRSNRTVGWQELRDDEDEEQRVPQTYSLVFLCQVTLVMLFAIFAVGMLWSIFFPTEPVPSETLDSTSSPQSRRIKLTDDEYPFREPIGGVLSCDPSTLSPSAAPPVNVHRVRPADIGLIAALGDSITVGSRSDNNDEDRFDKVCYVGNSFDMGGDDALETHLTLPNVLRRLNPSLLGYSVGRSLNESNAHLNVAYPGMMADDFVRQANLLVNRTKEIEGYEDKWKLVHFFIGTNEMNAACYKDVKVTSPAQYKENLLAGIRVIKKHLPRVIVSLIGIWNVKFANLAQEVIYKKKLCLDGFYEYVKGFPAEYRRAMLEIQDSGEFDSDDFTVVVQRIFDVQEEPPKKGSDWNKSFHARDVFHLSKYGNSLVARELWNNLLRPTDKKFGHSNFNSDSTSLECPEKACPYIRTVQNSKDCE